MIMLIQEALEKQNIHAEVDDFRSWIKMEKISDGENN